MAFMCALAVPTTAFVLNTNPTFQSQSQRVPRKNGGHLFSSTDLEDPPLTIVPAIDIYDREPPPSNTENRIDEWMSRRETASVDPFELVSQELAPFSDNIKELVETDQPVLSSSAGHFFAQRHGKRFRPTIVMLMAKATAGTMDNTNTNSYVKQAQLGQITEMIHVAR